jgi:hypothetical protein
MHWPWILLALAALAVVPRLLRRSRIEPLVARDRRFQRLLAGRGLARFSHEGPLDHGARASAGWPAAADLISRFASDYADLRYGGREVRTGDLRRLDELLKGLRARR